MSGFALDALRRWPDVEADNLHAVDAADRLVLDIASSRIAGASAGDVVVIGDRYGALTLGAIALHGARGIRVHQDSFTGERALAANAAALATPKSSAEPSPRDGEIQEFTPFAELEPALVADAAVILLNLPRSIDELDEIAGLVAAHARPDVVVFAGGMVKHMTTAMNDVLARHFERVDASLARQKARVITATGIGRAGDSSAPTSVQFPESSSAASSTFPTWPRRKFHADVGMWICAHGGAFAGTSLDIGTRALVTHVNDVPEFETALDLGCGTGVLATALALARPGSRVLATDQSAAAVASARATAAANEAAVDVFRDDAAAGWPDASIDLVVLNPPFHIGAAVHTGVAFKMFEAAARVLRPGGELWCVWNSHLRYAPALRRIVGPTRQIARTSKFTVTASRRTR